MAFVDQLHIRGALEQILAGSERDRLVQKLGSWMESILFSNIKVDLPGHVKPNRIVWNATQHGHEPDATAYHLLKQYVFEVETADSLGDQHTHEQYRLFAAYSRDSFAEFTLVVPNGYGVVARSQLFRWHPSATVLEI